MYFTLNPERFYHFIMIKKIFFVVKANENHLILKKESRKSVDFKVHENFKKFDFGSASSSATSSPHHHHHHSQDFENNLQQTVFSPETEQHGYSGE